MENILKKMISNALLMIMEGPKAKYFETISFLTLVVGFAMPYAHLALDYTSVGNNHDRVFVQSNR